MSAKTGREGQRGVNKADSAFVARRDGSTRFEACESVKIDRADIAKWFNLDCLTTRSSQGDEPVSRVRPAPSILTRCTAVALAICLCTLGSALAYEDKLPAGQGSYDEFVELFQEFAEWRQAQRADLAVPDYSQAAIDRRIRQIHDFQHRIADMGVVDWSRSQRADYLAALALLDEQEFLLRVYRPWSRDPGFYVDQMQRVSFTQLPVAGEDRDLLVQRLQRISDLTASAKANLRDVPSDFADLALHNLTNSDGVNHGHPYREVPPDGVLGWFDDLLGRAQEQQPELTDEIHKARAAAQELNDWLLENRADMTARAGIGEELLDWYLMHVKYMPYSSHDITVLAQRELERTWAFMTLDRHRHRRLPELELPTSREEYEQRIAAVDAEIRAFLVEEEFITIPDYIPEDFREMGFNVPWQVRDGGPNYWEQIQYRDPSPDHWHAVIPGHRFDGRVLARNTHPVRRHIRDGGRAEGWALYLEEAPLQLGFYDETRQRTRELIYNFAVFRAARTLGDVWLQRNEMTADQAVAYWMDQTPYLDVDVARVDAEIYLRRPPGYGLGYTIGSFQMYKLLADRKRQLGEDFVLREFHDEFMAAGGLPIALIRYEMTGQDDEVRQFFDRTPLSAIIGNVSTVEVSTTEAQRLRPDFEHELTDAPGQAHVLTRIAEVDLSEAIERK